MSLASGVAFVVWGDSGVAAVEVGAPVIFRPCPAPHLVAPGVVTVTSRGAIGPAVSAEVAEGGEPAPSPLEPQPLPSPPPVGIVAVARGLSVSGYVVHGDGVLSAFGGAPVVAGRPAGDERPVDVALDAVGTGGWVISAQGGVHGFGGAGDPRAGPGRGAVIAGDLTPGGDGYLLEADGRLRSVGLAPDQVIAGPVEAVDVAVRPGGDSGWVLANDGRLHGFGGAQHVAFPGPPRSHRAVVAARHGDGGWVVTGDGQILPFGHGRPGLPTPPPIGYGVGPGADPRLGSATGSEIVDATAVIPVRAPWTPPSEPCGATLGPQCYRCVTNPGSSPEDEAT